ncbi:MAG: glycosyltransferase family 2 protein [Thermoanaerobaculia bacterium]
MNETLSVVVPVYYNEHSLPALFDTLLKVEAGLLEKGIGLELIFVDDGSRDGSLAVLRELKQRRPATKVVKLTRNFGAVHASKTGFRFVTGDCFMILAADLQDPPELILEMADRWRQGAKFVVCVREDREDSALSVLFSRLYYRLVRWFVVRDYPPAGYDVALMSRDLLPYMLDSSKNVNTALFAYWLGFEPVKIRYTRRKRLHGKSRWTFLKRVKFFLDSILGFSIVPIRLMSLFGAFVALVSFGYGSVIAINALRGISDVPGFPTLVVILSFLLGIVIMMLGIIGEYLWRIFDEVSRKPEAVIDEVL